MVYVPPPPPVITEPPLISGAGTLVKNRFSQCLVFATQAWNTAIAFLNTMSGQTFTIPWTAIPPIIVNPGAIDGINPALPNSITIEDIAIVNRDLCLGCGLCASVCPEVAISLKPREDCEEPFNRVLEMGVAIIEAKRRTNED